jgi:PleD family two-component response regulator
MKTGKKRCIVLSGHSISSDEELYVVLQKLATVVKISDNHRLESVMTHNPVDLVMIEISEENSADLELIKRMKDLFPETIIILIDGNENREVISKAFSYGAKDAFRKPYKRALIVERVQALLSYMS